MGGYKVQAKNTKAALDLVSAAKSLVHAGCFSVVLEGVPSPVAGMVTEAIDVATIGIGAGPFVDGQILVLYDILGITQGRTPRFVQNFMKGQQSPLDAIRTYVQAIKDRKYPAPEHCFS